MAKAKQVARTPSPRTSPAPTSAAATFDAAARALPEEIVRNAPAYPRAWLTWASDIADAAVRDAAALAKVPLDDGNLTSDEILELAPLIEYVRASQTRLDADRATGDGEDSAFLATVRADQRKIIRAFRTLRFRRNPIGLALIRSLVRGAPNDPQDAVQDNTGLLSLCNSVDHEKWLGSLPNGEGAAAQRLWDRHNDLVTLAANATVPAGAHAARELTHRLWTLLRLRLDRVLVAGRYLTAGSKSRRAEYRGFRRPTVAKPKKK
ncbi:MAG: hypothetical protein JWM10_3421 [Myxococcaceae bacterium]|nr:hypothetical protein [Myxococcaceae bacterium]